MMTKHNLAVVITAAGSSTRMGGGIKKEYLPLGEGTVLSNALLPFLKALNPSIVIITTPENGENDSKNAVLCDSRVNDFIKENQTSILFVKGDKTRALSVKSALENLQQAFPGTEYVLIHDGARPFVSEEVILRVAGSITHEIAVTPALQPVDTQKVIDENGFITQHLVRSKLAAVQTPQGFYFPNLLQAHRLAKKEFDETGKEYTDDTEIWQKYFGPVLTVKGDSQNRKITYKEDII